MRNISWTWKASRILSGVVLVGVLLTATGFAQPAPLKDDDKLNKAIEDLKKAVVDLEAMRLKKAMAIMDTGDAASTGALKMPTTAKEYLNEGIDEFKKVLEMLKDPELEKELAKSHRGIWLAVEEIRGEVKSSLEKRVKKAGEIEQERLQALRDLNKTYRDLTDHLAGMNTWYLLQQYDKVEKGYEEFDKKITKLKDIVEPKDKDGKNKRRDYYLFEPEKGVDLKSYSDIEEILKVSQPVYQSMIEHFNALQGMTAYRLARVYLHRMEELEHKVEGTTDEKSQKALDVEWRVAKAKGAELLKNAIEKVKDQTALDKKPGVIPLYVRALANQELATLETKEAPLNSAEVKAETLFKASVNKPVVLKDAINSLQRATAQVDVEDTKEKAKKESERKEPAGKYLLKDLKDRLEQLTGDKFFTDEANRLTTAENPAKAAEVLLSGVRIRPTQSLIRQLALAQLRAGMKMNETTAILKEALKTGVLVETDPEGLLVRGRVELASVWDDISRQSASKIDEKNRTRLIERLDAAKELFEQASKLAGDNIKSHAAAYAALAQAYTSHLLKASDPNAEDRNKAARQVQTQMRAIAGKLKEQDEDPMATGVQQIAAREGLVAARLAEGYLALKYRPTYREDALLAFAAAADTQAKMKFSKGSVKLFGSPVLAAMFSRPELGGLKVAAQERQLRELLARVAEGLAALRLGAAAAAATQAEASLKAADNLSVDAPVDAAKLLDSKENDAREIIRTRTRALAVLTLIAGGQTQTALSEALKLSPEKINPDLEELKPADIMAIAEKIEDPLASFALGLAMEEYGVEKITREAWESGWRKATVSIQDKTRTALAKAKDLRDRYPQVVVLNQEALDRLNKYTVFLDEAKKQRQEVQIRAAVKTIEDGVKRHPGEGVLQQERLVIKLDEADLIPGNSKDVITKTLSEAERARKAGVLKDPGALIVMGGMYERLNKLEEALEVYETALAQKAALKPEDKLKAESRLPLLRLRVERMREGK